ncbi:MAG: hypothetical protein SFW35_05860 [Chitinophagales bacterium]|nr:hypothetical protein [Chitinophagales bacterium]
MAYFIILVMLLFSCSNDSNHTATSTTNTDTIMPPSDTAKVDGTAVADTIPQQLVEDSIVATPTNTQKSKSSDPMLGTWKWLYTSCCSRRPQIIKDTSAKATYLRINDNKNAQWLHGKQVTKKETFDIEHTKEGPIKIKFSTNNYPAYLSFKGDTMILNYGYMDLQTEYYLKQKP